MRDDRDRDRSCSFAVMPAGTLAVTDKMCVCHKGNRAYFRVRWSQKLYLTKILNVLVTWIVKNESFSLKLDPRFTERGGSIY